MAPLATLALASLLAVQASAAAIAPRAYTGYAPIPAVCPSTELVRPATSISSNEEAYITARKTKANPALAAWLKKTNSAFSCDESKLPITGLAISGGGYRSLLNGAGVIQALDGRDSTSDVAGLYQGLVYHAGLSGGAWLLSSFAGNNWPTISSLKTGLWETTFQDSLLDPEEILAFEAYATIVDEIEAKESAGYDVTIVDAYGRLLSYQLLYGTDGGVTDTLSGFTNYSNFTSHNVPYPIMTSIGFTETATQCVPAANGTQYEMHPYEWGSWDAGVKAFVQTKYLGSKLSNGKPVVKDVCVNHYDQLGYILGTSSDIFADYCEVIPAVNSTSSLAETLEAIVADAHTAEIEDLYARYPNPFANYTESYLVSDSTDLTLVDGGLTDQNIPIWPFIQPERNLSVLIASDNSADTTDNFPNGTEIYETYLQALGHGLSKMPVIPPVSIFVSEGLNKRATFFGCNNDSVITIVYLPNVNYTYASNPSTGTVEYSKAATDGIIGNGNAIAIQNGTAGWSTCLGCAIMKKTGTTLPEECTACFNKYCYN